MSKYYLLGIDIGTYESKGVITDGSGGVITSCSVGHGLEMPKPGWAEQDAVKIWWHDFVELSRRLLTTGAVNPKQIIGIGVSAIAPCVLPVDREGRSLRPGILYGIDTRALREIALLEKILGKETIFNYGGFDLSSQHAGPKILWIRNNEPEVWSKTNMILTASGYLAYKLTGQYTIDYYTASTYAPLFDSNRLCWSAESAKPVIELEKLPRLCWSTEVVGTVTSEAENETGLVCGTPVVAGTADAASESLSAGLSKPGDLMVMYGSSIFFILRTKERIKSRRFWGSIFIEDKVYVLTGGMSTAGSLTRWFRDQFAEAEVGREKSGGENAYAALARLVRSSPLGSNGVIVLPYFYGERTPIHDPDARGLIFGLTLKSSRSDIYRAVLEALGYGIRHNIDEMKKDGGDPGRILAVGGGTKNAEWMQIVSDIAGIEQCLPDNQLGACYGDAFLAGIGVGLFPSTAAVTDWVHVKDVVKPAGERHLAYKPYYEMYQELYLQTAPIMHRVSLLQKQAGF
ncbi:MAG: FGGY-family carbohydrate kinase [Spirochaetota bacterium]